METGADDFIAKPFRQPELLEKIRALLGAEFIYEDEGVDRSQLLPSANSIFLGCASRCSPRTDRDRRPNWRL